jgi:hypothetical protein
MLKYVFISLIVLSSCRTYANLIVDVEFTNSAFGSGSFTGIDLDDDGVLMLDELSAFTFIGAVLLDDWPEATITNIISFQDFYYDESPQWKLIGDIAFGFKVDGVTRSIGSGALEISSISKSRTDVTEPTSLAIFTLGLIGLASRRFKKKS